MNSFQVCKHWRTIQDGCAKCLSPECWDIFQVSFKITGVTPQGHRFKAIYTSDYFQAMGINLWRGNVWALFHQDKKLVKRLILKSVHN